MEAGNESCYVADQRLIQLSWRASRQTQLYHLLHECGHHLIAKSGARYAEGNGNTHATETRIAIVAEEIEAWHRGRKLANRLGIRINRKRWAKVRKESLATYLRWAANG